MSFAGGLLNFVAAVLNALLGSDRRTSGWYAGPITDDSIGSIQLEAVELGTSVSQPLRSAQDRAHDDIANLAKVDPNFSEVQFLSQSAKQYLAAMAAQNAMTADGLDGVATAGFIASQRARIADWNNAGLRAVVHDLSIDGSTVIRVTLDGNCESIMVRLAGTGVRCTQDVATGAAVVGNLQPAAFMEFATFVRPAGTTTPKSPAGGGAIHCPSCGAPTTAGAAKCPFCSSQLTGTGGTWLLDKLSASAYT